MVHGEGIDCFSPRTSPRDTRERHADLSNKSEKHGKWPAVASDGTKKKNSSGYFHLRTTTANDGASWVRKKHEGN